MWGSVLSYVLSSPQTERHRPEGFAHSSKTCGVQPPFAYLEDGLCPGFKTTQSLKESLRHTEHNFRLQH